MKRPEGSEVGGALGRLGDGAVTRGGEHLRRKRAAASCMTTECLSGEGAFELGFSESDFDRWHSCSCLRGSQLPVFAVERE